MCEIVYYKCSKCGYVIGERFYPCKFEPDCGGTDYRSEDGSVCFECLYNGMYFWCASHVTHIIYIKPNRVIVKQPILFPFFSDDREVSHPQLLMATTVT